MHTPQTAIWGANRSQSTVLRAPTGQMPNAIHDPSVCQFNFDALDAPPHDVLHISRSLTTGPSANSSDQTPTMETSAPITKWVPPKSYYDYVTPTQTPLTATPSTKRYQRPRPRDSVLPDQHPDRVPLNPSSAQPTPATAVPLQRQQSKASIRSLFGRNKSAKPTKTPALSAVDESYVPASAIVKPALSTATVEIQSFAAPTKASASRAPQSLSPKASKQSLTSKSSKTKPPKPITVWDPPPLFQAYPQAVKHASMQASNLSAEAILRISSQQGQSDPQEDGAEGRLYAGLPPAEARVLEKKRKEEKAKKHRRKASGSISKADWTFKIYVLVTSGYLLQYSGDGNFDRLPEKMMQLSKNSVAFASDAIPGKHWVLQISQSTSSDEVAIENSKSVFAKLGFQSSHARRSTGNFLLVCGSAEEMNSWLVAVRKEIEALGGREYQPENTNEDTSHQLHHKPSWRYVVNRYSEQIQPSDTAQFNDGTSIRSGNRRSLASRNTETTSWSTSNTTSTDQAQLDRLRENPRYSYVSTGTHASSPAASPVQDTFSAPHASSADDRTDSILLPPVRLGKRVSMPVSGIRQRPTQGDELPVRPSRPSSNYSNGSGRSVSPAPPRTTVPNFSKRYSYNPMDAPPLPPAPLAIRRRKTPLPPPELPPNPVGLAETPQRRPNPYLLSNPSTPTTETRPTLSPSTTPMETPKQISTLSPPLTRRTTPASGTPLSPSREVSAIIESYFPSALQQHELTRSTSLPPLPPPNPPPMEALPPLPPGALEQYRPSSSHSTPTAKKSRRPMSMQAQMRSGQTPNKVHRASLNPTRKTSVRSPKRDTHRHLATATPGQHTGTNIPAAPAAPPPTCALPMVPPIVVSEHSPIHGEAAMHQHRKTSSIGGAGGIYSPRSIPKLPNKSSARAMKRASSPMALNGGNRAPPGMI